VLAIGAAGIRFDGLESHSMETEARAISNGPSSEGQARSSAAIGNPHPLVPGCGPFSLRIGAHDLF
jgi:hypothetical protein